MTGVQTCALPILIQSETRSSSSIAVAESIVRSSASPTARVAQFRRALVLAGTIERCDAAAVGPAPASIAKEMKSAPAKRGILRLIVGTKHDGPRQRGAARRAIASLSTTYGQAVPPTGLDEVGPHRISEAPPLFRKSVLSATTPTSR